MIRTMTFASLVLALTVLPWLSHAAPALSASKLTKLNSTVMNMNLPLQNRVRALKKLHADQLVRGKIERSFCVWDPLGRNGPIYATVDDQKLRSLHYGLSLDIRAFTDEKALIAKLKSGECDTALVRGNQVYEFNKFTATLEAPGAVPSTQHLQILSQVIANPKTAKWMEQGDYVIAGVAYLGDSYVIRNGTSKGTFVGLSRQKLGVPDDDPALVAMAKQLNEKAIVQPPMRAAESFVNRQVDAILAPAVIYHALISGQLNGPIRIMNMPQSLSTMQLVARKDRFMPGLAQLLREDFLFKFDNYVNRVEAEVRNVPAENWQSVSVGEQQKRNKQLQQLRLAMRDEGIYDARMLKLMRKVRCKIDANADECRLKSE